MPPPHQSQNNFLELLNGNINKINSVDNKIYILVDCNINLFLNDSYILGKQSILNSKSIPSNFKSYSEFCTFFGLKQFIKVPTRTTTSSSTIIDHILSSYKERVTQCGVIDISLSDHELIYCTRKISGIKRGSHKQIQFCSFKLYMVNLFEQKLSKLNFPNYQNYNEINEACLDFIQKIMSIIDNVAPTKERQLCQSGMV